MYGKPILVLVATLFTDTQQNVILFRYNYGINDKSSRSMKRIPNKVFELILGFITLKIYFRSLKMFQKKLEKINEQKYLTRF